MQRTPVRSSVLKSVGYENGMLEIQFLSGAVYRYFDVPEPVHQALLAAPSKGTFFSESIGDVYRYERRAGGRGRR